MRKVLFLLFLLLSLFSCGKKTEAVTKKEKLTTVTGTLNIDLYGCCYDENGESLCTTCEDIFIVSDEEETEYENLKIINAYDENFNIYDFIDKKVKITGEIKKSQDNGFDIEINEISIQNEK